MSAEGGVQGSGSKGCWGRGVKAWAAEGVVADKLLD